MWGSITYGDKTLVTLSVVIVALVGGISALTANLLVWKMIEGINSTLPVEKQLSYVTWSSRTIQQYREMFPQSSLPVAVRVCVGLMLLSFGVTLFIWVF